jgi:hypothetical protein
VASAWAPRLITVELAARVLEGGKALLEPAALAELGAEALLAAVDCTAAVVGALRAAFMPEADCAMNCAVAALIPWLGSARAWALFMLELAAWETDGGNVLAPATLAELGAAARLAVADCSVASRGVLRAAFRPATDCAMDCAAAMLML